MLGLKEGLPWPLEFTCPCLTFSFMERKKKSLSWTFSFKCGRATLPTLWLCTNHSDCNGAEGCWVERQSVSSRQGHFPDGSLSLPSIQSNLYKEDNYCSKSSWNLSHLSWEAKMTPTLRFWGTWLVQSVKHLPSAQVMIPGSWDGAPHWAPCSAGSLLLPPLLPSPPSSCFVSVCLSLNK